MSHVSGTPESRLLDRSAWGPHILHSLSCYGLSTIGVHWIIVPDSLARSAFLNLRTSGARAVSQSYAPDAWTENSACPLERAVLCPHGCELHVRNTWLHGTLEAR